MKRTPGPWQGNLIYKGRITGGVYESDPQTCEYEKIQINNHNATVATVYRLRDARLIAAAPELLEAAKMALVFIESIPYEPSNSKSTKTQDALFDAISKAEGRE